MTVLIVPLWNWNTLAVNKLRCDKSVLIVPLWNWNYYKYKLLLIKSSSNCTFMELKYALLLGEQRSLVRSNCTFMELKSASLRRKNWQHDVLIVPLWNWNRLKVDKYFEPYCVLIVPLWNWNKAITSASTKPSVGSNCTFMELKYFKDINYDEFREF